VSYLEIAGEGRGRFGFLFIGFYTVGRERYELEEVVYFLKLYCILVRRELRMTW